MAAWSEQRGADVTRIRSAVDNIVLSGLNLSKVTVAASLLGDLARPLIAPAKEQTVNRAGPAAVALGREAPSQVRRRAGMASRPAILGWLLFDWACQPFFTLVTTFVFAPYFAASLAPDPVTGQSLWGFATAAAGLVLAFLSPILGSVADATGPKKPWIASCGLVLFVSSFALWFAAPGQALCDSRSR